MKIFMITPIIKTDYTDGKQRFNLCNLFLVSTFYKPSLSFG